MDGSAAHTARETIAMETRSKSRGGAGCQAHPVRNRRGPRSGVHIGEASGTSVREETTRTQSETDNEIGTPENLENVPDTGDVVEDPVTQPILVEQRTRKKFKWTSELNESIVRIYYTVTKLETVRVPKKTIHERVIEVHPILRSKSSQNVNDQIRSVLLNQRIPAKTLAGIRKTVAQSLGMKEEEEEQIDSEQTPTDMTPLNLEEEEIRQLFFKVLTEYGGNDPELRPRLPKLNQNRKIRSIIPIIDKIIGRHLKDDSTLQEIHELVYLGAYTALKLNKQKIDKTQNNQGLKKKNNEPAWERRINLQIKQLREKIGILTMSMGGAVSMRVQKKAQIILSKLINEKNKNIIEVLDELKQKLKAKAARIKRYKISKERREQNKEFQLNQGLFYKKLNNKTMTHNPTTESTIPTTEEIRTYWSEIWTDPVNHNQAKWIKEVRKTIGPVKTMDILEIAEDDVKRAVQKTLSWKAPGSDKIHNFWYKHFKTTHAILAQCFTEIIKQPHKMPQFMTRGTTYLIPKTEIPSASPDKYRPITCLPTIYKILTSIIANKIHEHLETNNLMDEEQKGARKGSRGCKEQLIIDAITTTHAKKNKAELHTAYIDYRKAFDSVPHSWLIEVLHLHQVEPELCKFLEYTMTQWQTTLIARINDTTRNAGVIKIRRGIFQGDALSPLWFCMALKPLTTRLNSLHKGYKLGNHQTQISHLLYMDDLKLYAESDKHLKTLLDCTTNFSKDIKMEFGLDKCKISKMKKGVWEHNEGYGLEPEGRIHGMEQGETYKYLGYHQAQGINQARTKAELTTMYLTRLRNVLKTQLNARNKAKAITTYAISMLTYSFGVIGWTDTDLHDLDTKTRTHLTKYRSHHPKSAVERFHLPRIRGGRGIPSIYDMKYKQVENLRNYFLDRIDKSPLHRAIVAIDNKISQLHLADHSYKPLEKIHTVEEKLQTWKTKALHGRYPKLLDEDHIDKTATTTWLRDSNIYSETEAFMCAIQDQVIATRYYRHRIFGEMQNDNDAVMCRLCNTKIETIDHIVAGCTTLASTQYTERHNNVAKILHNAIMCTYDKTERTPYYKYDPPGVVETENYRIYWNRDIITDRTITHNRPDIVLVDKEQKSTYIIDVAIPLAANISKKHAEKIQKYLALADEIKGMWHQERVTIIPIILGATAEIPKKLFNGLEKLQLHKCLYKEMQKAVILKTCNIVRRTLTQSEYYN